MEERAQLDLLKDLSPTVTSASASNWSRSETSQSSVLNLWGLNMDLYSLSFLGISEAVSRGHMRSGCAYCRLFMYCNVDC